jgi:hypothetical protein
MGGRVGVEMRGIGVGRGSGLSSSAGGCSRSLGERGVGKYCAQLVDATGVSGRAPGTIRGVGVRSGVRLLRALVAVIWVCSVLSKMAVTAPSSLESPSDASGDGTGNSTGLLFL